LLRLDVYFNGFKGVARVVQCKSIYRETVGMVTLFAAASRAIEFLF